MGVFVRKFGLKYNSSCNNYLFSRNCHADQQLEPGPLRDVCKLGPRDEDDYSLATLQCDFLKVRVYTLNFAEFSEHQKRVKLHQVGVNLKFTLGKCKLTIRECIFTPRLGYANTVSV